MTSNDITAPRVVKRICQLHQPRTRANTTMPTIIEKLDDTIKPAEVNNNDGMRLKIDKVVNRKNTSPNSHHLKKQMSAEYA